jgi:acetyl-CoA carboxylase carboxyl transferase subunit beta
LPDIKPTKVEVPEDLWLKCKKCGELIYTKELDKNLKVCPECNYHFPLSCRERVAITLDEKSFREYDWKLSPSDPLGFVDLKPYPERLRAYQERTGLIDAIIAGEGKIGGHKAALAVIDSHFMMGSMGTVMGEIVTRMIESAISSRLPVIIINAGGGGARMQEGILSLMQMAKTNGAVSRLHKAGLLYISVLTDPTMGGVMASFASQGHIIIAEPGARLGFSGPRVAKMTIGVTIPDDFQRAEPMQKRGLIDMVVPRRDIRPTLIELLDFFLSEDDWNGD